MHDRAVAYAHISSDGDTLCLTFREVSVDDGADVSEFSFGIRKRRKCNPVRLFTDITQKNKENDHAVCASDLPRYPQEFTEDLSRNSHARGEIIIINRKEEKLIPHSETKENVLKFLEPIRHPD